MKLDRNINTSGWGKYALVNMRKLGPMIDGSQNTAENFKCIEAYYILKDNGFITEGNESPGDQFFVMKYKDKFTAPALHAYAIQVMAEANGPNGNMELCEYAEQMFIEAKEAAKLGNRIPD